MGKPTRRLCVAALACALLGCDSSPAAVSTTASALEPWTILRWDTAVGRVIGHEADSEGPKAFCLKPDGGAFVLDQVNRRVLGLDAMGQVVGTIPLPAPTFDDVEQFEGRAVLVLDRTVGRRLLVLDREGAVLEEVALPGRGIERSGLITAMFSRPDGVWLEVEHRHSVRVLDRELNVCDRQVILGRPIANGQSLRGTLDGRGGVGVSIGPRTCRRVESVAMLDGQAPIERIVWLDADAAGRVHVVLHEVRYAETTAFRAESERYLMVVLDGQLRELARSESPWVLTAYNQRVEFRLGPDGRLWQMAFTPDGVVLLDWGRRVP